MARATSGAQPVPDTAALIDDVIGRLEDLRGLLADDAHVCRLAGMRRDEQHCIEAVHGIARLLPSLERARLAQDAPGPGPRCVNCDE